MSWQENIKERISSWISRFPVFTASAGTWTRFFHPESPQTIRRLQFFWMGCGSVIIVAFAYGIATFLFEKTPLPKHEAEVKVTPTSIETATKKVNLEQAFRTRIEDTLKSLADRFTGLESMVLEGIKREGSREWTKNDDNETELEAQPQTQPQALNPELSKDQFTQELQNKIAHLEEQVAMNRNASLQPQSLYPQGGQEESVSLIQKVSLGLTENPKLKLPKTVDTTIPAGAFAKTILLSGLDASSAMTASSDPRPMLLRLIDPGTLPRRFQSDLKDCHSRQVLMETFPQSGFTPA